MMANTIQWWSESIRSRNAVFFPGGKGKVPTVDPRDIAVVACSVLTQANHEGQIYEVTGPQALAISDMVEILADTLGKSLRYVDVPALMARLWMRRHGMTRELTNALMETLRALRKNEYSYVTDIVERIGGAKPQSFSAWCRANVAAFQ